MLQIITLSGVDDFVDDGNIVYTVTINQAIGAHRAHAASRMQYDRNHASGVAVGGSACVFGGFVAQQRA
ncbi:MAG: hypothetical protein HC828_03930 [Blastochloris sp.]|nr:hypothetical protein [Blastochloris sp.]